MPSCADALVPAGIHTKAEVTSLKPLHLDLGHKVALTFLPSLDFFQQLQGISYGPRRIYLSTDSRRMTVVLPGFPAIISLILLASTSRNQQ